MRVSEEVGEVAKNGLPLCASTSGARGRKLYPGFAQRILYNVQRERKGHIIPDNFHPRHALRPTFAKLLLSLAAHLRVLLPVPHRRHQYRAHIVRNRLLAHHLQTPNTNFGSCRHPDIRDFMKIYDAADFCFLLPHTTRVHAQLH